MIIALCFCGNCSMFYCEMIKKTLAVQNFACCVLLTIFYTHSRNKFCSLLLAPFLAYYRSLSLLLPDLGALADCSWQRCTTAGGDSGDAVDLGKHQVAVLHQLAKLYNQV